MVWSKGIIILLKALTPLGLCSRRVTVCWWVVSLSLDVAGFAVGNLFSSKSREAFVRSRRGHSACQPWCVWIFVIFVNFLCASTWTKHVSGLASLASCKGFVVLQKLSPWCLRSAQLRWCLQQLLVFLWCYFAVIKWMVSVDILCRLSVFSY